LSYSCAPAEAPPDWPAPPDQTAFIGPAGDLVRLVEPHSEADPVALLVNGLLAFGNVVGASPHFVAEADRHPCRTFAALVGETSKGRKGSSWGYVRRLFAAIDPAWERRVQSGLSSGEGLIWAVRDPIRKTEPVKQGGRVVGEQSVEADPGVADKRLFVMEGELSRVLRVMKRETNSLSPVIRELWDTGDARILTKSSPATATGAHVGIVGHITRAELADLLCNVDLFNGFANRFLWICVRRSKCLPEGGNLFPVDFLDLEERLRRAVAFARSVGEMHRDDDARALWAGVYPALSEGRPGLLGAATSRAEAQVARLSCMYALSEESDTVGVRHLVAALALWDYAFRSARFIFGDSTGDRDADELLEALKEADDNGMTRTEIRDFFGRNKPAEEVEHILNLLANLGKATFDSRVSGGRPEEVWYYADPSRL
jgi:hypothetical protein